MRVDFDRVDIKRGCTLIVYPMFIMSYRDFKLSSK